MFSDIKIKTFELGNLVGRNVSIMSFMSGGLELIIAIDTMSGELFVLDEKHHPVGDD